MPTPLLAIHIAAGTLSVLGGAAALALRKGGRAHRTAGSVFVVAMLVMAATAAALGRDVGNAVAGGMTIYMVATAWMAARRADGQAGAFEIAAFGVAIVCGAGMFATTALIASGARPADNPYIVTVGFLIAGVIVLAALGDLSVVLRRGVSGAQRIARHLWRMCFGLVIAVGSFAAQGAAALPPEVPRAELLFGSMILVLLVMAYWLVRVRLAGWPPRAPRPA